MQPVGKKTEFKGSDKSTGLCKLRKVTPASKANQGQGEFL